MTTTRRHFLQTAAGVSAAAFIGHAVRPAQAKEVTIAELDAAAAQPVLKRELFDAPVVVDSIRLLKKGSEHYVHIRSKDGAEGITLTNERAEYLYPVFNKLVAPYMLHFASFTPEIGLFQEYKLNIERYRDWFQPVLSAGNGSLRVPEGPGVGIRDIGAVLEGAEEVM